MHDGNENIMKLRIGLFFRFMYVCSDNSLTSKQILFLKAFIGVDEIILLELAIKVLGEELIKCQVPLLALQAKVSSQDLSVFNHPA